MQVSFVPKPAGGAVTPSWWSDSADGRVGCVRTEFTFQRCSVGHQTQGAADTAAAFPVAVSCRVRVSAQTLAGAPRVAFNVT